LDAIERARFGEDIGLFTEFLAGLVRKRFAGVPAAAGAEMR
jgi:hypothetical protein